MKEGRVFKKSSSINPFGSAKIKGPSEFLRESFDKSINEKNKLNSPLLIKTQQEIDITKNEIIQNNGRNKLAPYFEK